MRARLLRLLGACLIAAGLLGPTGAAAAGSLYVTQGGVYVVQVYNDNPRTPIDYALTIEQG